MIKAHQVNSLRCEEILHVQRSDCRRRKIHIGKYPKCHHQKIIQIKDTFHSNAAGNIAQAAHFFTKNKSALITFYICENCGYIEEYLDQDEIVKLK